MLAKHADELPESVLEERLDVFALVMEGRDEGTPSLRRPSVQTVDLVARHHEGRPGATEDLQALDGLRLEAFHDVHHEDGDVGQLPPTRAQRRERVVTRGVDEQQAGGLEVPTTHHRCAGVVEHRRGNLRGADVLRDATRLSVHDRGLAVHADGADQVEKAGLAVVNVTKDADDRLSVFTALRGFLFRGG